MADVGAIIAPGLFVRGVGGRELRVDATSARLPSERYWSERQMVERDRSSILFLEDLGSL